MSVYLGFFRAWFGDDPDLDQSRVSDQRDPEVCHVVDELTASRKISAERDFDIGNGISEGDEAISQKVDAQKIGVGENFGADGSLETEGAGNTGVTAGMADVRLVVESGDGVRSEHPLMTTELSYVVKFTDCWFAEKLVPKPEWRGFHQPGIMTR